MNRTFATVLTVLALVGVMVLAMFFVQNSSRTTLLSLDLGVVAWQLREPLSVSTLIGISVGIGFVPAALYFGYRAMRASSRARRLEQELALVSSTGDSDGWK